MGIKVTTSKHGDADEFHIYAQTGTVVADRAWGRSIGGGYIGSQGGSVSISNTDVTRLFVKDDNGQEFETELQNTSVTAREGHRVTCVYATSNKTSSSPGVAFINHTTGRSETFDKNVNSLLGSYNLNGCGVVAVILLLSIFVLPVFAPFLIFLGIPIGILVAVLGNKGRRQARRQEILARIRNEVQRIIDKENTRVSEA